MSVVSTYLPHVYISIVRFSRCPFCPRNWYIRCHSTIVQLFIVAFKLHGNNSSYVHYLDEEGSKSGQIRGKMAAIEKENPTIGPAKSSRD